MHLSENDLVAWAHSEMEGSDLGSEKVLVDFRQGRYFGLNETGTLLFSLMREPVPVHDLIDAVTERYGVDRDTAASDVFAFLKAMHETQLIQVRSNGALP